MWQRRLIADSLLDGSAKDNSIPEELLWRRALKSADS
jgi:hypothetical protein